ncbi:hypothetical protein [Aureimonas sp. SK2]|uniref:hypothetical protein n=1 Tax=Aureimonas sp. SK2 TaxID=3015992 RepID=UPI002444C556|nr:hypothetical protein [Aureimonas sp. SK2]
MTNRQDRRFAAKLARQAARRGKAPAERALLVAASAYSAEQPIELDFGIEGIDAAWVRLEPELWDILDDAYEDFRRDLFADAAWGPMVMPSASGGAKGHDLQPIFLPVTGRAGDLSAFAADAARRSALANSLRASGIFPEDAGVWILPVLLAPEAVDLRTVGPAAAFHLTLGLAEAIAAPEPPEADSLKGLVERAGLPIISVADGDTPLSALFLGVALTPADEREMTEEEAEARRLSMAATRASWLDTYAADLPFRLDEPVLWHEAGSSLAWHGVVGEIEAEIAQSGGGDRVTQLHACLLPEQGEAVLAAKLGDRFIGPFHASKSLVATDVDGFAGLAEHFAGELVEHEPPEAVLRLVGR